MFADLTADRLMSWDKAAPSAMLISRTPKYGMREISGLLFKSMEWAIVLLYVAVAGIGCLIDPLRLFGFLPLGSLFFPIEGCLLVCCSGDEHERVEIKR